MNTALLPGEGRDLPSILCTFHHLFSIFKMSPLDYFRRKRIMKLLIR